MFRLPTRREWWVVFHPRQTVRLLDEREDMIRKLAIGTVAAVDARLPPLQQIIDMREEARTQGAVAAYRAAKRRFQGEGNPSPNAD